MRRQTRPTVKKRRIAGSIIFLTVLLQLITAIGMGFLLLRFGPFPVLQRQMISTIMETRHKYFASWFFNDAQVKAVIKNNVGTTDTSSQNVSDVQTTNHSSNIDLYDLSNSKYKGFALVIQDPSRVHIGASKNLGTKGETVSGIARDHNAIAAINGGGFKDGTSNWTGTGAFPTDFLVVDGNVVYKENPSVESPNAPNVNVMAFDQSGHLIIGNHNLHDLLSQNIRDAFTFHNDSMNNVLVLSGKGKFTASNPGSGNNPRTAIGQTQNGSIILMVVDGRSITLPGATLYDMQQNMLKLGAYNATNIDGGSSSTMYYQGKVINTPCNPTGERSVPTAIYVTK